ncbi:ADP-ribosyltransferase [Chryseobacterium sp.]|uniref:ADP-ribosyltransferase n=1 Tax=Chryseobacterium sp. TaxID=1871047 RepID=UPI0011CC2018|nr:ADP-ribosyltransferase [Chryseobacterium sp.]TXF79496.1 hypothetical protein FUA25_03690 [Chryseobacterium sp.]
MELFKVGKEFTDAGFFSTTYTEKALLRWMRNNPEDNVLCKVYGKNGKLIEKASAIIIESEILLKSNTTFIVEGIKPIPNPVDKTKKVLEIILKEK